VEIAQRPDIVTRHQHEQGTAADARSFAECLGGGKPLTERAASV
jgi:hypothetical protein